MTSAQMEKAREDMACRYISPPHAITMATRALLMAYGEAPVRPERAADLAQFAADMLRASLPETSRA